MDSVPRVAVSVSLSLDVLSAAAKFIAAAGGSRSSLIETALWRELEKADSSR